MFQVAANNIFVSATKSLIDFSGYGFNMVTPSHRLVYGTRRYLKVSVQSSGELSIATLTSLQVLSFLGLPIKLNLDLETFEVR